MIRSNIVILSFALTGCAGMLTHIDLSDKSITSAGRLLALIETCAEVELSPPELASEYIAANNNILSVSSFSAAKYEEAYKDAKLSLRDSMKNQYSSDCGKFNEEGPALIKYMRDRYDGVSAARRSDIRDVLSSISAMNPNNQQTYQAPTFRPAPQVTMPSAFSPTNKPQSYLINSEKGMSIKHCKKTDSGVTICY